MKFRYILLSFCILYYVRLSWAQNSNTTAGGFMSQVNSWISRLRGHNHNNNNSDKDEKKEDKKNNQNQQMRYPGMMPYPVMPSLYAPMGMPFGPRPMAAAPFGPGFGSLAAGSSMGPSLGPMSPSFAHLNPSYAVNAATNLMPVHDYSSSNPDFPISYGMSSTFGNGFGGLSSSLSSSLDSGLGSSLSANLGPSISSGLGSRLNQNLNQNNYEAQEHQIEDHNSYNGDESNPGDEYSGYQR